MAKLPENRVASTAPAPPPPSPCKLLEDMRNNPAGDWTIKNIETLCGQTGLVCKPPRRGSHYKVLSKHLRGMLTIPANRKIKAPYVRQLIAMADAHISLSATGE